MTRYTKLIGARQTLTAKASPDGDSTIDLTDLPDRGKFYLAFEPGRARDVVLLDGDGGEFAIPELAGGDDHYATDTLLAEHGPFTLEAASDTSVTLSVHREI